MEDVSKRWASIGGGQDEHVSPQFDERETVNQFFHPGKPLI